MLMQHWLGAVILFVVAYYLGSKYPGLITKVTAGTVSG